MEGKDLLKKWFYTQGTQAASASARIPLLDASGNPIGSDTMANLASVLGARVEKVMLTSQKVFTDVPRGSFIFICYEYSNLYGMGFCGRNGYVKILGTLFDGPVSGSTISINYSRDNKTLTLTSTGGAFGLEVVVLGARD